MAYPEVVSKNEGKMAYLEEISKNEENMGVSRCGIQK
jgi:hypothetical protein